jgi:hypothetical protein
VIVKTGVFADLLYSRTLDPFRGLKELLHVVAVTAGQWSRTTSLGQLLISAISPPSKLPH